MAQVSGLAQVCEKAGSVVEWLSALVFCLICFACVYRAPTKIAKHSVTFEKAEMRTNWRTADGIQSQKRIEKAGSCHPGKYDPYLLSSTTNPNGTK